MFYTQFAQTYFHFNRHEGTAQYKFKLDEITNNNDKLQNVDNPPLMPSRSTVLASSNNLCGSISNHPGFNCSICN